MKMKSVTRPFVPGIGQNIAQDGLSATVIFDQFFIELSPVTALEGGASRKPTDEPMVAVDDDTLLVVLDSPTEFSGTLSVRGFAALEAGISALASVHVAGKTQLKQIKVKGGTGDYQWDIKFKGKRDSALVIRVGILLERDMKDQKAPGGLLTVDSVDWNLTPVATTARKAASRRS